MKVLNKFILIDKIIEQKETKSGLLLSGEDSDDLRYHKAIIVSPGTNVLHINAGDTILFDKVAGHDVFIGENRYYLIQEKDVVCVLD
jgi:co-chaperonin GroES (HSP10)